MKWFRQVWLMLVLSASVLGPGCGSNGDPTAVQATAVNGQSGNPPSLSVTIHDTVLPRGEQRFANPITDFRLNLLTSDNTKVLSTRIASRVAGGEATILQTLSPEAAANQNTDRHLQAVAQAMHALTAAQQGLPTLAAGPQSGLTQTAEKAIASLAQASVSLSQLLANAPIQQQFAPQIANLQAQLSTTQSIINNLNTLQQQTSSQSESAVLGANSATVQNIASTVSQLEGVVQAVIQLLEGLKTTLTGVRLEQDLGTHADVYQWRKPDHPPVHYRA